jgi:hypothetical protein
MRPIAAVLLLSAAAAAAGCGSTKDPAPGAAPSAADAPVRKIKASRVIWTRGGKVGYLQTYDMAPAGGSPVEIHYAEDLDFRERGWVANDGQGVMFRYPEDEIREAFRAPFFEDPLPTDTIENNVKRIFGLDPRTEIAFRPASEADVRR